MPNLWLLLRVLTARFTRVRRERGGMALG